MNTGAMQISGRVQASPRVAAIRPSSGRVPRQRTCATASGSGMSSEGHALPLPINLFVPYKNLPPNGQIIPRSEEECDVMVRNCKTQTFTFDTQCACCHGTGYARAATYRRGGRGSLRTCVVCIGMGHVRRTTSRYAPEIGDSIEHMTLARQQKLPGEPEQRTLPSEHSLDINHISKLKERAVAAAEKMKHATGTAGPVPAPAAAAAAAKAAPTPSNNIVPAPGAGALAGKQTAPVAKAAQ